MTIDLLTTSNIKIQPTMSLMDAIAKRRSVRTYSDQLVSKEVINVLLSIAVRAPTAVHEEPWIFVVIQDSNVLNRLSDDAKKWMNEVEQSMHVPDRKMSPNFVMPENVFYNAPLVIVICAKPAMGSFVVADCWLAAENLMLAACAMGLGTCVSGLAVAPLNTHEWKRELGIPEDVDVVAPIIVGVPSADTKETSRKPPVILVNKNH